MRSRDTRREPRRRADEYSQGEQARNWGHVGIAFVYEHNPYNPVTVQVVRACEFDEHAVLVPAFRMLRRLRAAGFGNARISYRVFFPRLRRTLRVLERWDDLGAAGGAILCGRWMILQGGKFVIVGLLNSFIGLAVIYVCKKLLGTGDMLCGPAAKRICLEQVMDLSSPRCRCTGGHALPGSVSRVLRDEPRNGLDPHTLVLDEQLRSPSGASHPIRYCSILVAGISRSATRTTFSIAGKVAIQPCG